MKVITRNGKTLPVDISTLDEDEIRFLKAAEHVTMIDDGCYLKKCGVLQLKKIQT